MLLLLVGVAAPEGVCDGPIRAGGVVNQGPPDKRKNDRFKLTALHKRADFALMESLYLPPAP
jgi:hypothetical protein